ncbi:MAG TPA: mevalonate kinase [Nitrososphaera sp.]|jgi:mevalonate kinase|nr:mevalonate kinase [Nitrososphaera sp.]
MTLGKASAPAKIILFGEHFVVYGNPAILASISRRITVAARTTNESKIVIRSDIGAAGEYSGSAFKPIKGGKNAREILDPLHSAIKQVLAGRNEKAGIEVDVLSKVPHGLGLGSSAASCVATAAAVDSLFGMPDRQKICKQAIESERIIHKNSSGADCYVSTFGGLIHYSKPEGFTKIESKSPLSIVIGSTGVRHSTGDLVASVKKFKDGNEALFDDLARQARDICTEAVAAIPSGKKEKTGELLSENQALLKQIGVSHEKADDLIDICNRAGALGAKITGAGGGGAVIALAASKQDSAEIAAKIKAQGYDSFEVEIDYKGLVA